MEYKIGSSVEVEVDNILATGIVVHDTEQNCMSAASLDADILIPLSCCNSVRVCSGIELCTRTFLHRENAYRIYLNHVANQL